jgi:hypothetical protein
VLPRIANAAPAKNASPVATNAGAAAERSNRNTPHASAQDSNAGSGQGKGIERG